MKLAALLLMAIIIPANLGGQEVQIEFVQPESHHHKPPKPVVVPIDPPQPPAPPKPPPAPVPPVVPTPQCEVVCYPVYVVSTPAVPVSYTTCMPTGWRPVPGGCGFHPFRAIGRALFGRCR